MTRSCSSSSSIDEELRSAVKMSGRMSTGLNQHQAGQQLGISVHEPVAQGQMIPVRTHRGKALMSTLRQLVVFALDDQLGVGKGIVLPAMIHVEMGTDEGVGIIRLQAEIGKVLDDTLPLLAGGAPVTTGISSGSPLSIRICLPSPVSTR